MQLHSFRALSILHGCFLSRAFHAMDVLYVVPASICRATSMLCPLLHFLFYALLRYALFVLSVCCACYPGYHYSSCVASPHPKSQCQHMQKWIWSGRAKFGTHALKGSLDPRQAQSCLLYALPPVWPVGNFI